MKVYVITGSASSGKTTTIQHLEKLGFPVMHEIARSVIKEGRFKSGTFEFQAETANRHLAKELGIRDLGHGKVFLDRGLYDTTAYCKYFKITPPNTLNTSLHYDAVFVLDSLGQFERDGIRIESGLDEAEFLGNLISSEYKNRNIPCVNVPVMSVEERVKFILENIK